MDRRQFLSTGTAAAAFPILASALPAKALAIVQQGAGAGAGDGALNALFDRIFQERVRRNPTFATSLGLDEGPLAGLKSKLDLRPAAQARAEDLAIARRDLASVKAISPAALSPSAQLNREVVIYQLETATVAPGQFDMDSVIRPYPIFQQGGAYFSLPDFLNTAHTIDTAADAEAYLSRLEQVAVAIDNNSAEQRNVAACGMLAPQWSIDLTVGQMRKLRSPAAEDNTMVDSIVRRTAAKGIVGDWKRRAATIVAQKIYPALDRQMALLEQLKPSSRPGDGAWRLDNGEAIYAAALQQATTTTLSPEEVHKMGLDQVAYISSQLDSILRDAGYTQGSVGARLAQLNTAPSQVYPNTDSGRAELLASLNADNKAMYDKLGQAFATLPTQPLEIRRVPVEIQDGASNGYYNRASLDGSRPAIFFINLKDNGDWPKYSLPALVYHEGVPGHHLQISISQESKDIPMLRKVGFFSAYSEGWALYAEQLSDELGGYDGIERAGYLQSFLFRAARLVVDTGLHTKRWSREQATKYLVDTTGFAEPRSQREVERYCTQIGQACSYKVGHGVWTKARAEAQAALGDRFDLKQFHEVLKDGAMPLTVLERHIKARTAAQLA